MKVFGGLLVFSVLLGGLYYLGFIGTPSPTLDEEEIQYLESVHLEPIHQSMSVAQAYRAIPHNQVTYRSSESVLKRTEAEYFEQTFSLIDLAVVERISLLQNIQRKANEPIRMANYEQILKRLMMISVPPGLEYFHQQVVVAIMEEKHYYQGLGEQPSLSAVNQWHPLIRRPHRRLVASYKFLASRYPQESRYNQQAFFEHLCALDFI
jgi:hypothetical protein